MSNDGASFCDTPLWDSSLSFNTTDPDLTTCFQKTVLLWIPCGFLFLISPYRIYSLWKSKVGAVPLWAYNVAKLVLGGLIGCLSVSDLFYSIYEWSTGSSVPVVNIISPLIVILSMILYDFLVHFERQHGIRTSGYLVIFWILLTVATSVPFQSNIRTALREGQIEDLFRFITFNIHFPIVLVQLVLSSFVDKEPEFYPIKQSEKPCPESSASFLSQITFWWFTSLVKKGYRKALERRDLWSLNSCDTSQYVVPKFEQHWNKELNTSQCLVSSPNPSRNSIPLKERYNDSRTYTEVNLDVTVKDGRREKKPNVLKCLVKTFGRFFLLAAVYKLMHDILLFAAPALLRLLIQFVKNKEEYVWHGYLYASALLVCAVVQSLILHQYFHSCLVLGMRLRTVIIAAVYRKTLKLSSSARKKSTMGEIVNLMSVDAQRFMDLMTYFHTIWSGPFQISVCLYLLWQTLGPPILAGVGVMVLLVPVSYAIANKTKYLQTEQMNFKDSRIKLMNEILNGMKVLKLYAWELSFQEKVVNIRNEELEVLKKSAYLNAISTFAWTFAPFLVSLVTFGVYVLSDPNNVLDAEKAFVSLSLFNIMRFPLAMFPQVVTNIVQANVSLKRVQKFLTQTELDPEAVQKCYTSEIAVKIENGTFAWDVEDTTILTNINLEFPQGSLVAVVGMVGSGKSSLLSALLGEMDRISGSVCVTGSVAYVAQQAWIQNCTLQDNILFGKPLIQSKYNHLLEACALGPDLDMLPAGDQTEIGEKGINLSGGQKQRVSVARAVYQDKDVYLFDDPLSAVDAHVGKHIFDNVIGPKGILSEKTRILVTHGINFLPQVNLIVVLVDGQISEVGSYSELMTHAGAFALFLKNFLTIDIASDEEGQDLEGLSLREEMLSQLGSIMDLTEDRSIERQRSVLSETFRHRTESVRTVSSGQSRHSSQELCPGNKEKDGTSPLRDGMKQTDQTLSQTEVDKCTDKSKKHDNKLIKSETLLTGRVKLEVFLTYLKAVGLFMSFGVVLFFALTNAASISGNVWLSDWSNDALSMNTTSVSQTHLRLTVYGVLGLAQGSFMFAAIMIRAVGARDASVVLHMDIVKNLLCSPMSFFDTTPLGRIVNVVGKDMDIVDTLLPATFHMVLHCLFHIISTFLVISISTPYILIVLMPLMIFYVIVQRFYVSTSRQLKRLESVSRSPIYSHFGETLIGVSTIRAFKLQERFITESEKRVDENQICYYPSIVANRWLAVRLEFVGNCIIFFASLFVVLGRNSLSPGIVGLSVSYAMNITQILNWMVRMMCDLETNIVAVERIKELSETQSEADWIIEDRRPDDTWPQQGLVQFDNYQTRYRKELDLALKGISCTIQSGEKVGIVGRTGAGKSSLTLALFRIIEATGGRISIDGINIADIGLHDLRSRLTIIPQDPVLFSGSLRMNLDPFDVYSDKDIWLALELAHLKNYISSLSEGLLYECSEGGENLSVGQRQLLCLARALLRKSKILILDEATAAVDLETDDLIQTTIRAEFKECTVLTIAHRLHTIMDYTKILVLDAGEVREFEDPQVLLRNTQSLFYKMAKDAGLA
ncbi:multidrug resistance-associated protein 1-like isoform X2 [Gigantopelta aegis]|uniref:multidrug resistance-associated protein 1-like isoform X2 n=1 Tax=Gigantopelta aegis TaxID=1735272 RepID=UPI001B88B791|nr:multidrug resistance-associated protein 1-like isoform X2 [Gigantopelta aegis]